MISPVFSARLAGRSVVHALSRIARIGAVLLAHVGVVAWVLSAAPLPRLPPEPIRMDVSLVPRVAPRAPEPEPSPRAEAALARPPEPEPEPRARPPRRAKPQPKAAARAETAAAGAPAAPTPDATAAPVAAAAIAPAPSPAPAPALVEARFDADYLRNPAPVYPPMSRRRGEQGKVLVLVEVTPGGLAGAVSLRQGSGYPRLDEAALKAVRGWRFVPARRGETAVAASVVVPVTFRLEG